MPAMQQAWPAQADYIMALQDPRSAFLDPALQAGTVECDSVLDLPKPRSGQMASVYKVFDGPRTWAVRCFNFASGQRAMRYRAISNFLARNANRYTVDFAYVPAGIVVSSATYPIVKMEWVEGDLLHAYIAKHLADPAVLQQLARAWLEMLRDLSALGMAHGDLQHGNVLVTPDGELKLVDYDGMFVPQFADWPSIEAGHPNYQHPCRKASDFGPGLDTFSGWVIYLSIVAVAHDPGLWDALGFGEDCLALRGADFARPSSSAAFAALEASSDRDVRNIARFLRSLLTHDPLRLPALDSRVRVIAAPGPEQRTDLPAWRFAPFESEPLPGGTYREPFVPLPANKPEASRPAASAGADFKPPRILTGAAGGIAASLGASLVFYEVGFAPEQYLAVVSLGWILAVIIAVASRGPRARGAPPS